MDSLNIVFCGTPEFSIPSLEALHKSKHNIIAVYTQPDRPSGRGQKFTPSPVKNWALHHNISVYQPINFKNSADIAILKNLKPDLLVVIAYGIILPKTVLEIPKLGCINVHASILPNWRGASPIHAAVLSGDSISGVTIMKMDIGMDTGDILYIAKTKILPNETTGTLNNKLAVIGADALLKVIDNIDHYLQNSIPQNHDLATYAGKISKEDALINWHQDVAIIDCKIRGYNPWPVAYTEKNSTRMKIFAANIINRNNIDKPGAFLVQDNKLLVYCNPGILEITKLQMPGGKIISGSEFINSKLCSVWCHE